MINDCMLTFPLAFEWFDLLARLYLSHQLGGLDAPDDNDNDDETRRDRKSET